MLDNNHCERNCQLALAASPSVTVLSSARPSAARRSRHQLEAIVRRRTLAKCRRPPTLPTPINYTPGLSHIFDKKERQEVSSRAPFLRELEHASDP